MVSPERGARIFEVLSGGFFGAALVALAMAEFGFRSILGGWQPTHEIAISYGVLSIASALISILYNSRKKP